MQPSDLRSWQIIISAAVVATLGTAAPVFLDGVPTSGAAEAYVRLNWPTLSVVWLTVYSLITFGLAISAEIASVQPVAPGSRRVNHYAVRLVAAQFPIAVMALVSIGLAPLGVNARPTLTLSTSIAPSLPLVAAAVLAFLALGGALAITITNWMIKPGSEQPRVESSELLLRQILSILEEEHISGKSMVEVAERVEQGLHSMLTVTKDVATAVNRLRRSLDEIKLLSQSHISANAQAGEISPADLAETTNELRSAAVVIDAAVGKLSEVAALLSAGSKGADAHADSETRLHISGELKDLLQQLESAK